MQLIAAGIGIVYALGWPAQSAFVGELVGPAQLRNAISINSSIAQLAALIGPALGGLLISTLGPGWSVVTAAICFTVPLVAVTRLRTNELHTLPPVPAERGHLRAGLRFAWNRSEVLWPTLLVGVFGIFTGNLAVTLAVYAKSVFDTGPGGYGLLSGIVAVGSVVGALISTRQHRTRLRALVSIAAVLSTLYVLAAAAPGQPIFCAMLLGIGATTLLLQTSAMSTVQLAAHGAIRGRVVGLYLLVWSGGIAIGGPLVGAIDQYLGPRFGMLAAGLVTGIVTVLIAARLAMHLHRSRRSTEQVPVTGAPERKSETDSEKSVPVDTGCLTAAPWVGPYLTDPSEATSKEFD